MPCSFFTGAGGILVLAHIFFGIGQRPAVDAFNETIQHASAKQRQFLQPDAVAPSHCKIGPDRIRRAGAVRGDAFKLEDPISGGFPKSGQSELVLQIIHFL